MNKTAINTLRLAFACLLVFGFVGFPQGQSTDSNSVGPIRSSAAYAEILLRKTELQADIEAFGPDYTEASAKMIELRAELASLNRSLERVFAVRPSETGKLTQGLGKLIVRKAALDADLDRSLRKYSKEHPETKRAQRRADRFEAAIAEILK